MKKALLLFCLLICTHFAYGYYGYCSKPYFFNANLNSQEEQRLIQYTQCLEMENDELQSKIKRIQLESDKYF